MLKKALYTIACLFILLLRMNVSAAGEFYASYIGGVTFLSESDLTGNVVNEVNADLGGNAENISLEHSFDTGFVMGGNGGYDFGSIRAEGEVTYRRNDLNKFTTHATVDGTNISTSSNSDGYVSSLGFMANCFLDYDNDSRFTPYGGGGVGLSITKHSNGSSQDDTVFAYQLGAGLAFEATEFITIELSYRFFGTSDPELGSTTVEYITHNILLGFRFTIK